MIDGEPDIVVDDVEDDDDESREERFKRIAEKRVNRILGDLALLEQMGASGNYKYSMDQVEDMLTAIDQRVERVRQRYMLALTREKPTKARHSFKF